MSPEKLKQQSTLMIKQFHSWLSAIVLDNQNMHSHIVDQDIQIEDLKYALSESLNCNVEMQNKLLIYEAVDNISTDEFLAQEKFK